MDRASIRARLSGRAWWVVKYTDGSVIREWDCDWSSLPPEGRQSVRLYCPNGQVAELGSTEATGRLFQLKVAVVTMGGWSGTLAHLIGHVEGSDGSCRFAAWEYGEGKLVTGYDNVKAMQYQQIGRVAEAPMGLSYE